jgi:hypothetical protein
LGDFQSETDRIIRRNRFYASSPAEQERLFGKIKIDKVPRTAAAA